MENIIPKTKGKDVVFKLTKRGYYISHQYDYWVWLGQARDADNKIHRISYEVITEDLKENWLATITTLETKLRNLLIEAGASQDSTFTFKEAERFLVKYESIDGDVLWEVNPWEMHELFPALYKQKVEYERSIISK